MDFFSLLTLFGGLAMFLYGMRLMGDSLKESSSGTLKVAMEHVTNTINTSIAEINRLIDGSNDILVNFELNSDINSAKADEIVKMFDSNGFSIFENTTDSEPKITFAGHNNDLDYFNNKADAIKLTNNEEKSPKSKYFG